MKRAHPVEMRKALEAVNTLRAAGILFVPIPVINEADHAALQDQMMAKLEQIEKQAEEPQQ